MSVKAFLLAGLCLLQSEAIASAESLIDAQIETYPIPGQTREELRDAIIRASRALGNGAHGAASATFKFVPLLDYLQSENGCVLSDVRVRLEAAITLPEWVSSRGADEATVAAWRRFERYVKAHEARHEAIAADFRRTLERELDAIGVMESCPALGREAVAVVSDIERMHDEAQIEFDREERARSSLLGQ